MTINVELTRDWQQIATAEQGVSISLPFIRHACEIAVGTTGADPAHRWNGTEPGFLTRAEIGQGAIFARAQAQGDEAVLALTVWEL